MPKKVIKTTEQVKREFKRKGLTFSKWARDRGFSAKTVYAVLNGVNKGNYGQAHEIAVELGIKDGSI